MGLGDNNMSGYQTFADFVRNRMGARSQREVALKGGLSQTTIGNYLLDRLPDMNDTDLIRRIAAALDSTPEEVIDVIRGDQKHRATNAAIRALPADTVEAVALALRGADLPEEGKQQIIDFAQKIREKYPRKLE